MTIDGPTLTWLLTEIRLILAPPVVPFNSQRTMIFFFICFPTFTLPCYCKKTKKTKQKTRHHCLTCRNDKLNLFSAATKHVTQQSNMSDSAEQQDYRGCANAVCVCLCLLTEIIQEVFSKRCCAHFLALIRTRASVCHVRSEAGGDRSGGRTMKMSFIQAEMESVKNTIESNNLAKMYSNFKKPYGTIYNYTSCIRCGPADLIRL